MTAPPALGREEIVAMLAAQQNQPPDAVPERIDSLDLVWLLHSVQERYGIAVRLSDADLAGMLTVSDAVAVLRKTLGHAVSH